jgi:acetyl esterase
VRRAAIQDLDLDDPTRRLLAALDERQLVPGDHLSLKYLRDLDGFLAEVNGDGPPMHAVHEIDDAPLSFRLFQPIAAPIGTVVYFGGGWAPDVIRHVEPVLRKLAERTSCVFAEIDAGQLWAMASDVRVERTVAVFDAAVARAEMLVHDEAPLVVAGGGPGAWCAATCAEAKTGSAGAISLQVLVCPLLSGDTDDAAGGDLVLSASAARRFWSHHEPPWRPLDAPMSHAVPDTIVLTAGHDVLQRQGVRYVARLRHAGHTAIHHDFPRQIHGFVDMLSLPLGELAFQRIIRAVRSVAVPRMPPSRSEEGQRP